MCGHIYAGNIVKFSMGNGCEFCGGSLKIEWSEAKELLLFYGAVIDEEVAFASYVDTHTTIKGVKCPKGHELPNLRISDVKQNNKIPCMDCYLEEQEFIARKYLDGGSNTISWIVSRVKRVSDLPWKKLWDLLEKAYTPEELKLIADVLNSRPDGWVADHIVPFSFFDMNNIEEIRLCNSHLNLRPLSYKANDKRKNNLTLTELVQHFNSRELRIIYNAASNLSVKRDKGLRDSLPVEDEDFELWKASLIISDEDKNKFDNWNKYR